MPINNTNEAKSRRPPGELPSIIRRVADAESALLQLPDTLKNAIGPIVAPLMDLARQQDRFNLDMWLRYDALPGKHGSTHTDGDDSIASDADPTAISLTNVAYPGDPHHPLSREGHVHPIADDLAGLATLGDVTTETINGYDTLYIYNPATEGLLEEILVELRLLQGDI